jgi:hypothetical protein
MAPAVTSPKDECATTVRKVLLPHRPSESVRDDMPSAITVDSKSLSVVRQRLKGHVRQHAIQEGTNRGLAV